MWICINNLDQVIWLADTQKRVWHLNIFNMTRVSPFTMSGLFYQNSLDPSIYDSRVSGQFLLLLCFIEISIVNANIVDPDQRQQSAHLIWVCTVCQLTFWGSPEKWDKALSQLQWIFWFFLHIFSFCRKWGLTFYMNHLPGRQLKWNVWNIWKIKKKIENFFC